MKNKFWITPLIMITGCVLMFANSCKKPSNEPLKIGQSYQGGIIAYILQPGDTGYSPTTQHGLIAAPADQASHIQWYNGTYLVTGATGVIISTGKTNTDLIIAKQGAGNYAASLCAALTLGGYTDWYLPSEDELNELNLNQALIGGFDNTANYWSSTEGDLSLAWLKFFSASGGGMSDKFDDCSVRAVRSF